jgi:hypothetical protein
MLARHDPVPPQAMPVAVLGAQLHDAFDGAFVGAAGPAFAVPDADGDVPARDVALLALAPSASAAVPLPLATRDMREKERVYLAGKVRSGAPATQQLHPAEVSGPCADGTILVSFDVGALDLAGASGAPVLTVEGAVAGILVRMRNDDDVVAGRHLRSCYGFVLPVMRLRAWLA